MNPISFRDFLIGLLAAAIGGAVNAMAVMVATGFTLDSAHGKGMAVAAIVGGLFNAAAYLKTPQRTAGQLPQHELSGPQAPVPTTKPEEVKP